MQLRRRLAPSAPLSDRHVMQVPFPASDVNATGCFLRANTAKPLRPLAQGCVNVSHSER